VQQRIAVHVLGLVQLLQKIGQLRHVPKIDLRNLLNFGVVAKWCESRVASGMPISKRTGLLPSWASNSVATRVGIGLEGQGHDVKH